jgi:hypothetical protein
MIVNGDGDGDGGGKVLVVNDALILIKIRQQHG